MVVWQSSHLRLRLRPCRCTQKKKCQVNKTCLNRNSLPIWNEKGPIDIIEEIIRSLCASVIQVRLFSGKRRKLIELYLKNNYHKEKEIKKKKRRQADSNRRRWILYRVPYIEECHALDFLISSISINCIYIHTDVTHMSKFYICYCSIWKRNVPFCASHNVFLLVWS